MTSTATTSTISTVPTRVVIDQLKVGDRLSNVETMVIKQLFPGRISVATDGGHNAQSDSMVSISHGVINDTYKCVDQVPNVKFTSRTKLVEVLRTVHSHLFWVKFTKQNGEERTMYCKLAGEVDDCFGRSSVWEQVVHAKNITYQKRLIDHRTMNELKFDGTHYIVKSRSTSTKSATKNTNKRKKR